MKLLVFTLFILFIGCDKEDKKLFELNKSISSMVEPKEYINDFDQQWKDIKEQFDDSLSVVKNVENEQIKLGSVETATSDLIENYVSLVSVLEQAEKFYRSDIKNSFRVKKIASYVDLHYLNYLKLLSLKIELVNRDVNKGGDPFKLVMDLERDLDLDYSKLLPLFSKFTHNYKKFSRIEATTFSELETYYTNKLGKYKTTFTEKIKKAKRSRSEIEYDEFLKHKKIWDSKKFKSLSVEELKKITSKIERFYNGNDIAYRDLKEYISKIWVPEYRRNIYLRMMTVTDGEDVSIDDLRSFKKDKWAFKHYEPTRSKSMFDYALGIYANNVIPANKLGLVKKVAALSFSRGSRSEILEEFKAKHAK